MTIVDIGMNYTDKLTTAIIDKIIEERAAPYLEDGNKVNITKLPKDPEKRWEWFENVRAYMNFLIFVRNFQQQFPKPHAEIIRAKLRKMQRFIDLSLKENGERNWFDYRLPKTNSISEYRRAIYAKLIVEFYKEHPYIDEIGYTEEQATTEAEVYGEYVWFKKWLEDHPCLGDFKTESKGKSKQGLTMRQKVEKAFAFMQENDPRKHKQILSDTDYQNLIDWVTYFFENNFSLPEIPTPIQKVNTDKGSVVYTFKCIFDQEHPNKDRPDSLFELIKACFYEYRNDDIENFKKRGMPQYYRELISK